MNHWYRQDKFFLKYLLTPLSYLFRFIVFIRKALYQLGLFKAKRFPVPIIVIGNLTVGGTGKTPLLIALADYFKSLDYQVGIVSRGYGGRQKLPHLVSATDDPLQVGDEALLLARNTQCPVVVARDRAAAASYLLEKMACTLILSDDGLQHYGLRRDIEVVVVDGQRKFGNGACLPAGPLREPLSRLKKVDFVIMNDSSLRRPAACPRDPLCLDESQGQAAGQPSETLRYSFTIKPTALRRLVDDEPLSLADCQGKVIYAMAGIGNPQRFFDTLRSMDLIFEEKIFPDHHAFTAEEIAFPQAEIIIMTEKDAVKCKRFADSRHFYLPITVVCQPEFLVNLSHKLRSLK